MGSPNFVDAEVSGRAFLIVTDLLRSSASHPPTSSG